MGGECRCGPLRRRWRRSRRRNRSQAWLGPIGEQRPGLDCYARLPAATPLADLRDPYGHTHRATHYAFRWAISFLSRFQRDRLLCAGDLRGCCRHRVHRSVGLGWRHHGAIVHRQCSGISWSTSRRSGAARIWQPRAAPICNGPSCPPNLPFQGAASECVGWVASRPSPKPQPAAR
jgi:hypothetical protein